MSSNNLFFVFLNLIFQFFLLRPSLQANTSFQIQRPRSVESESFLDSRFDYDSRLSMHLDVSSIKSKTCPDVRFHINTLLTSASLQTWVLTCKSNVDRSEQRNVTYDSPSWKAASLYHLQTHDYVERHPDLRRFRNSTINTTSQVAVWRRTTTWWRSVDDRGRNNVEYNDGTKIKRNTRLQSLKRIFWNLDSTVTWSNFTTVEISSQKGN